MSERTRDEIDLEAYTTAMRARGWRDWKSVTEDWMYYWWWDEDPDGWPIPVHIMHSPTEQKYFANIGQHGWNRPQNVEEMGGWWMKAMPPATEIHPLI